MGLEDHENMMAMLKRKGIEFEQGEGVYLQPVIEPPSGGIFRLSRHTHKEIPAITIAIHAGYSGFYTLMSFDKKTGDLLAVEAYER